MGIGIIGYSIGRAHAHAWSSIGEYYYPIKGLRPKVVAMCGRDQGRLAVEAGRFGIGSTYADWRDLVKDEKVDVVDDCAPPSSHEEPMTAAAELGKNLFCEKPLARNSAEAKRMLEVAERNGVKHMVGYNYRFLPAVSMVRDMVTSGELGRIYFFKGAYLNSSEGSDNPLFTYGWHHDSKISGYGALSDLGTHTIDLARFLVGEVSSVSGAAETFVSRRRTGAGDERSVDVDDLTIACLKFRNGALGVLESSWLATGRTDYLRFEIYGSLGSVRYNLERIHEIEVFKRDDPDPKVNGVRNVLLLDRERHPYMKYYWSNQGGGYSWEHTFVNELAYYLGCISEDRPVGPLGATFEDGYANCQIMDAISESARSEKWVGVNR